MKTFLTIGLSVGAVGSVVAGGLAAGSFLAGGGTQPEDVVPASAIAFAKVDLNPSAGQKLNALRLMRKFPETKDAGEDLKATIVESLLDESDLGLKYEADIEPWLGDRAAIAVVPSPNNDDGVAPLVVLEFTDQEAMTAALSKAEKKMRAESEEMYNSIGHASDLRTSESEQGSWEAGGTEPGAEQDMEQGMEQGTYSGSVSSVGPGTVPERSATAEPGTVPETFATAEPGTAPETFATAEPGTVPGADPNADPDARLDVEPPTEEDLDPFDYAVRDNFVILAEHQSDADKAVLAERVLAEDEAFSADKAAIDGTDQIVLGWVNVGAVYDVVPEEEKADFAEQFGSARPAGRLVVGVHAEPDAVEAVGRTVDLEAAGAEALAAGGPGTGLVKDLPADTAVAFSATGLGDVAADLWDKYGSDEYLDLADESEDLGLTMPDDLVAVLGQEGAVGVGLAGIIDGEISATARVRTQEAERALEIVDMLADMEVEKLHSAPAPEGYVVSSDRDDMADAFNGDLSLADNPVFANAVPDADDASALLFVDIPAVIAAIDTAFGGSDEFESESEEEPLPFEAFGATATGEAGNGTFKLRLTFR